MPGPANLPFSAVKFLTGISSASKRPTTRRCGFRTVELVNLLTQPSTLQQRSRADGSRNNRFRSRQMRRDWKQIVCRGIRCALRTGMVHGANHLRQVRWVIGHYSQLQGWRLVPLGLVFLASGAWRGGLRGWLPHQVSGRTALAVGIATALALSFPIKRWYRRTFGGARSDSAWRDTAGLFVITAGFIICTVVADRVRMVSIPALFVGCALLSTFIASDGRRWHYAVVASSWLLFSIAPATRLDLSIRATLLDALIGGSLIVCGLGDHRLLSKALAVGAAHARFD